MTPLRIGVATAQAVNIFPLYMAKDAGLFEKYDISPQIVEMDGGSVGVQVLLSGDIQILVAGLSVFAPANAQGADLRLIAASSNVIRFVFFTRPDIKTGEQLKGKTVGISKFGSETDVVTSIVLNRLGLSRKDVAVIQVGSALTRMAALQTNQVQAAPLNEPATTAAKERGLDPIMDLVAEQVPWLMNGIVVQKSTINDKSDLLKRFLSAYAEGAYLALSDKARSEALMAKLYKIRDPKVLDITYEDFKAQVAMDMTPTKAAAENVLTQNKAMGVRIGSDKVSDYVDTSLVDDLNKQGLFKTLQGKYLAH